jgi:hypothetical protein
VTALLDATIRDIPRASFIGHEHRSVLNGSLLEKEYSANALNEHYLELQKAGREIYTG